MLELIQILVTMFWCMILSCVFKLDVHANFLQSIIATYGDETQGVPSHHAIRATVIRR